MYLNRVLVGSGINVQQNSAEKNTHNCWYFLNQNLSVTAVFYNLD
jgi:hypothetical protein